MALDLTSGLFALGGVALAGAFAEIRAVRESRARRLADIESARRNAYALSLRRVEAVASKVAVWAKASPQDEDAATRAVWDAITVAYETLGEVRLISRYPHTYEVMHRVIDEYRAAVEQDKRMLPNTGEPRSEMVAAFRKDLGATI